MATVWLATREDVTGALDVKLTARISRQIDRAIESASRSVEGRLHRTFRPVSATRYFNWPDHRSYGTPWRLWLDANELISVTSLSSGGSAILASHYFLEPADYGPPYTSIELDLSGPASFSTAGTHQRAVAITGLFGYSNEEDSVGNLGSNLGASAAATASMNWTTPRIGVGDVLRIDNERVIVTDKNAVDSGQNLGGNLTAQANNVIVPVPDGTAFAPEELLLIDAERMRVLEIAGNNLIVKRAWDGTVLAAHTSGADIYTITGLTLDRGQLGTTLAAHTTGATVYRHNVPGLVRELTIAEAINLIQQEATGYARRSGLGEERGSGQAHSQMEASGRGLDDLREQAYATFGRKARVRAI